MKKVPQALETPRLDVLVPEPDARQQQQKTARPRGCPLRLKRGAQTLQ